MPIENKLNIDRQTLLELEIISDNDRIPSIFNLLNKTKTQGGRDKLRRNFLNPANSIEKIQEIQESVKHIADKTDQWKLPVDGKLMDHVEFYYFLNIDPVISKYKVVNFFEGIRYGILYRSYVKTFKEGSKNVTALFKYVSIFINENFQKDLPALLKDIFKQINSYLEIPFIKEIIKSDEKDGITFLQTFTIDQNFRMNFKDEMGILIDLIYELDVLISMAQVVKKFKFSFPEFISDENNAQVDVTGLWHPFVNNPQTNDLRFDKEENFIFLTGPNMAGKTTYLKAVGVAVYLAHLGYGVPAQKMKLTPFNNIFSSINTSDNLSKGYSYFYSEVLRVKEAAIKLKKHKKSLMIFDELFRGTNVKDAYDGSLLVIKGLMQWQESVFILSSHLIELAKEVSEIKNIKFNYFESGIVNNKPIFSYKILEGISDERLGLLILKNAGIEELLELKKQPQPNNY